LVERGAMLTLPALNRSHWIAPFVSFKCNQTCNHRIGVGCLRGRVVGPGGRL